MGYYFNKILKNVSFDEAINSITKALSENEFDIVSKVDFTKTFKEKLGVDFSDYVVLGTCNPALAYEAVQSEDFLGLMLPCNVLVKRLDSTSIEVAIVDPEASLSIFDNEKVDIIADKLQDRLVKVINSI